jgi:cysteinyl-tRNA synthetase
MHNGLVGVAGEKMSKSLGNSLLVDAMVTQVRPVELRYYLGQAHYRSNIEYSPAALEEAVAAYARIEGFVTRAAEFTRTRYVSANGRAADYGIDNATLPRAFVAALDNDLAVPQALAVVHETIRHGNGALKREDAAGAAVALDEVRAMLSVLGLDPLSDPWAGDTTSGDLYEVVDALVKVALDQRQAARDREDWQTADAIRDRLLDAGVLIEDYPHGSRWEIKR